MHIRCMGKMARSVLPEEGTRVRPNVREGAAGRPPFSGGACRAIIQVVGGDHFVSSHRPPTPVRGPEIPYPLVAAFARMRAFSRHRHSALLRMRLQLPQEN